MAAARFLFITLDCRDPAQLAGSWSVLLDTPVEESIGPGGG